MNSPGGKARVDALEVARALWEETHASTDRRCHPQLVPKLAELQTKLDSVRREVRNLTVMGWIRTRQRNRQRSLKSSSGRREQSNVSARWRLITRSRGKLDTSERITAELAARRVRSRTARV